MFPSTAIHYSATIQGHISFSPYFFGLYKISNVNFLTVSVYTNCSIILSMMLQVIKDLKRQQIQFNG